MRAVSRLAWVGALLGLGAAFFFLWPHTRERADPTNSGQVALGRTVYAQHCAACHGTNLEGQPNWRRRKPDGRLPAPPHDITGHTWEHPDETLFQVIKFGVQPMVSSDYQTDMPAFGGTLSDEEIWAVIAFIKSRWPQELLDRLKGPPAR